MTYGWEEGNLKTDLASTISLRRPDLFSELFLCFAGEVWGYMFSRSSGFHHTVNFVFEFHIRDFLFGFTGVVGSVIQQISFSSSIYATFYLGLIQEYRVYRSIGFTGVSGS